jgi:hypothetical protein
MKSLYPWSQQGTPPGELAQGYRTGIPGQEGV